MGLCSLSDWILPMCDQRQLEFPGVLTHMVAHNQEGVVVQDCLGEIGPLKSSTRDRHDSGLFIG